MTSPIVLRGNYVPTVSLRFDDPDDHALKYVKLDGRGIRDLAALEEGFLVLAGPIGDGDGSYELYWWNGEDCLTEAGRLTMLGELTGDNATKPEGLAIRSEDADRIELLVISDGRTSADVYEVPKP